MVAADLPATGSPPHGGADRNWLASPAFLAWEGRPLTGARIETPMVTWWRRWTPGRPLTGARIETTSGRTPSAPRGPRSPPHGGADRNALRFSSSLVRGGRPLTGARIETVTWSAWTSSPRVAPSRGRGSKPFPPLTPMVGGQVAPSRGRGSKL